MPVEVQGNSWMRLGEVLQGEANHTQDLVTTVSSDAVKEHFLSNIFSKEFD